MNEPHHLANAPIREAVVDLFVEFPTDIDRAEQLKSLKSISEHVADRYPTVQQLNTARMEVDFSGREGRVDQSAIGYSRINSEKNRIIQFRRDGFTVNWLRPYQQWDDLRSLAIEMWKLYWTEAKPSMITRIGLRYINDLPLPIPINSFGDFLVSDPIIPNDLPQAVSRFVTQVTIEDEPRICSATITHAFEGIEDPRGYANVILDIDTRIHGKFKPDDSEIWLNLDHLHEFKNRIFFSSLTEKALRLFE